MSSTDGPQSKSPAAPDIGTTGPEPCQSLSMHDGVQAWEDCCSCEAEPYWREAFADTEDTPAEP